MLYSAELRGHVGGKNGSLNHTIDDFKLPFVDKLLVPRLSLSGWSMLRSDRLRDERFTKRPNTMRNSLLLPCWSCYW